MPSSQAQEFLFQRIKELLPPSASLTDAISEILHVSNDSAYRRIRNETPLVLEEAKELCEHFHLSLDQVLNIKSHSILFEDTRVDNQQYPYKSYISDLLKLAQYVNSFQQREIIFLTKDVPLFHLYFQPLMAFRHYFWMKAILQHPDYATRGIDLNGISDDVKTMNREAVRLYTLIPSSEIWNTECVNSLISQIEFFKESGLFSSAADIKVVYQASEEMILHLKKQAEYGCKFMPEENPQTKKENFNFFYNRLLLGETTILVKTDNIKTVFLNYDVLNYITTRDEAFCNKSHDALNNLMRKSTLISQTGERQRNIFFGILLAKIEDRLKKI
jgi:hypothetical protein